MADASFVDIVEKKFYWPTHPWATNKRQKLLAMWFNADMQEGDAAAA
jgi:hypothetical protein